MSHRITINAEIKDREAAMKALTKKKWNSREEAKGFRITDGPMVGAFINLSRGTVEGDTDVHSRDLLSGLNQAYNEEVMLKRIYSESGYVENRIVLHDGTVRLIVQA